MGNVLRILKRDMLRLLKAPAALIVVGALLVLPSLYSWYNVAAFWNPYEATGNLKVSVVNQDAGAENDLVGKLNVGDRVTEELLANDKLDFVAEDLDEAMSNLEAGKVYAVYVLPEDFSENLISPLTGHVKKPVIKYYANEKLGPVSPKITDTAASTLEQTINSMFVTTASEAAVEAVDDALKDAGKDTAAMQSKAVSNLDDASASLAEVHEKLDGLKATIEDARVKTASASSSLDDALVVVGDARAVLDDITAETETLQTSLASASSGLVSTLSSVVAEVSQITKDAGTAADALLAMAGTAQARVDLAAGRLEPLVTNLADTSAKIQAVADALPDDNPVKARLHEIAQSLSTRSSELQTALDEAEAVSSRIYASAQTASDAAKALTELSQQLSDALQKFSEDLYGSAGPAITKSLVEISTASADLSAATSDLETTIKQAKAGLAQLDSVLANCVSAVDQTNLLVAALQGDVDSLGTDIRLLAESDAIARLAEAGNLDAESIGEFMGAPTELEKVELYSPNSYGTAMAPLFMNLTFWIGAFMLVIIFRVEVDEEGLTGLTFGQRYYSRFLLFSGMAAIQAIVCCTGILALGVQVSNIPAFYLAAVFSSLAFLSVIYALSATLHHIGKALCIILVFAQIPGGSGLYPLELTDSFFQAIYPFLPFSYGIGALREAICGFYGNYYAHDLIVLVVISAIVLILGRAVAPLLSTVLAMASRQVREGDLYNAEKVTPYEQSFSISHALYALSSHEEYHIDLQRRYAQFSKKYPIFIRGSIILGVGVPVVLLTLLTLDAGEKVVLLTIFLLWLVALVVFLLVVESHRYNLERELDIERMPDEGLAEVLGVRGRAASVLIPASRFVSLGFGSKQKADESSSDEGDGAEAEEADDT